MTNSGIKTPAPQPHVRVTDTISRRDLLQRMSFALDDLPPNETIGYNNGVGWIEVATVEEIRRAAKTAHDAVAVQFLATEDGEFNGNDQSDHLAMLPNGWKPVPKEPTPFMVSQAIACDWRRGDDTIRNIWRHMLDATPSPQSNVRVDVDRVAASIVTAACELDGPADPADDDTISITIKDLEAVVHRHITASLEGQP